MIESEEIEVKVLLAYDLYKYIVGNYLLNNGLIQLEYWKNNEAIWVDGFHAKDNESVQSYPRTKLIIHNTSLTPERWNAVLKELQRILLDKNNPSIKEVRMIEDVTYHRLKIIGVNWHA